MEAGIDIYAGLCRVAVVGHPRRVSCFRFQVSLS